MLVWYLIPMVRNCWVAAAQVPKSFLEVFNVTEAQRSWREAQPTPLTQLLLRSWVWAVPGSPMMVLEEFQILQPLL